MARVPESVARFLQGERLAVAGVSRHADVAANAVFIGYVGQAFLTALSAGPKSIQ